MLKVAKRQRDGGPSAGEAGPSEATLKPCFTPPSSPDKRSVAAAPSPLSGSSSGSDEDAMNDFTAPKRRRTARRRHAAPSTTQSVRAEAVAAAATAADSTEYEGEAAKEHSVVKCPCCGHDVLVPQSSTSNGLQGRLYTLNDVKRIVQTAVQEQDSRLRLEYEKRLQYQLEEQRKMFMSLQESSAPSKFEYSYIS